MNLYATPDSIVKLWRSDSLVAFWRDLSIDLNASPEYNRGQLLVPDD